MCRTGRSAQWLGALQHLIELSLFLFTQGSLGLCRITAVVNDVSRALRRSRKTEKIDSRCRFRPWLSTGDVGLPFEKILVIERSSHSTWTAVVLILEAGRQAT